MQEYRRGIELISAGSALDGFEHLNEHGYIHEDKAAYLERAAEDFVKLTDGGRRPLDCIAVSPTNKECDLLTDMIRQKMTAAGRIVEDEANPVESFRSWGWTKPQLGNIENYQVGMKIFFNTKVRDVAKPGEMAEVVKMEDGKLVLSNGKTVKPSAIRNSIDAGNAVSLPVGKGDIVRFTVNLRTPEYKINNGSLAIATGNRNEYLLLDSNRRELTTIRLPENFRGLKYGWVMTSHASQGMTSKNVVVAAEKMSKQAFYVGCSRGKFNLALHVPEKEYFKKKLMAIRTERLSVHDLIKSGEITKIPVRKSAEQITQECRPDPHQLVRKCWQDKLRDVLRKITKRTRAALSKMLLLNGSYQNRQAIARQEEKDLQKREAPAVVPEKAPVVPEKAGVQSEEVNSKTDAELRELEEFERQFYQKYGTEVSNENRKQERTKRQRRSKSGHGMGFD